MVALSSPCWESTRDSRDGLEGLWAVLWPQICLGGALFPQGPAFLSQASGFNSMISGVSFIGLEQDDGTVEVHYYARGVTQSLKLTQGLSAKEFY